MKLKVEGLLEAAEVWAVALADGREVHVFGRRTLPQMDLASAACAIQNLWLAVRAEGLGVGWVSMFDPAAVARLLQMPEGAEILWGQTRLIIYRKIGDTDVSLSTARLK